MSCSADCETVVTAWYTRSNTPAAMSNWPEHTLSGTVKVDMLVCSDSVALNGSEKLLIIAAAATLTAMVEARSANDDAAPSRAASEAATAAATASTTSAPVASCANR